MLILVDGIAFPNLGTEADGQKEVMKLVNAARKKRRKLLKYLGQASSVEEIDVAQHNYAGSAHVRFAAMIDAAKKLAFGDRENILAYRLMASQLDITKPIDEKVYFRIKEKASGGYRRYLDYGIRHRTAQTLVADMLRSQFNPAEFQYDVVGRGVQAAIKAARQHINEGYRFGRHLDIKSFFDMISHKYIEGPALKLEPGIKSAVLTGKHVNLVKGYDKGPPGLLSSYSSEIASAGTPQGSATSPLVASMLLSKLDLSGLPAGVVVLNYVDDFLLLAKEETDLEAGSNALQAALTALSAGELTLAQKSTQSTPKNFVYLGHQFDANAEGKVSITASSASLISFTERVNELSEALENEAKHLAKLTKTKLTASINKGEHVRLLTGLASWMKSWLLAFSQVDNEEELKDACIDHLTMTCGNLSIMDPETIWQDAKPGVALRYSEIVAN